MSGKAPEFARAIPILRIFSVDKAKEFYLDFLGLTLDWEHRFDERAPLFMRVSRGGLVLYLSEHHGDGTPGTVVDVEMTGLDRFHAEVSARNYGYMRPGIDDVPWGARVMTVVDPFGNHLRFSERKT